jgi:hypothetical protein
VERLSKDDIDLIAEEVAKKFIESKRAHWVDPEVHAVHHEFIKQRITDEEDYRRFRRRAMQSALLWMLPIILGFIGLAVWRQLLGQIKEVLIGQ